MSWSSTAVRLPCYQRIFEPLFVNSSQNPLISTALRLPCCQRRVDFLIDNGRSECIGSPTPLLSAALWIPCCQRLFDCPVVNGSLTPACNFCSRRWWRPCWSSIASPCSCRRLSPRSATTATAKGCSGRYDKRSIVVLASYWCWYWFILVLIFCTGCGTGTGIYWYWYWY